MDGGDKGREVEEGVSGVGKMGMRNMSMEVMLGLGEECVWEWMRDMREGIEVDVEEICG